MTESASVEKGKNPFDPSFDHSKCYGWCGNPFCQSAPCLSDDESDAIHEEDYEEITDEEYDELIEEDER